MEIKNRKNYYPHAILIGIILMVIACIATVNVALKNPVEMDDFYFEKYQTVDRDINEIEKMQNEFAKKFDVNFDLSRKTITKKANKVRMNEPIDLGLSIFDKQANASIQKAKVLLLITRPDTSKYNKELNATIAKDGRFTFDQFSVDKPGRWQVKAKMFVDKYEGFYKTEINATK